MNDNYEKILEPSTFEKSLAAFLCIGLTVDISVAAHGHSSAKRY